MPARNTCLASTVRAVAAERTRTRPVSSERRGSDSFSARSTSRSMHVRRARVAAPVRRAKSASCSRAAKCLPISCQAAWLSASSVGSGNAADAEPLAELAEGGDPFGGRGFGGEFVEGGGELLEEGQGGVAAALVAVVALGGGFPAR